MKRFQQQIATLTLLGCFSLLSHTALGADIPSRYYQPVTYLITLKGDRGQFASVENDGKIHVNRSGAFRNEIIALIDLNGGILQSGDEIALKSWQGWNISARYDMGNVVLAGSQWGLGAWEKFRIYKIIPGAGYTLVIGSVLFSQNLICIKSSSGAFLSARYDRQNTPLTCDQPHSWAWETFQKGVTLFSGEATGNYAIRFAFDYNNQFYRYDNDCTNFASQALFAGGLPLTSLWKPDSVSWIRADGLYQYLINPSKKLADLKGDQRDLKVGDIIAVDWTIGRFDIDGQDGIIDHMMVVSEVQSDGRVRVSYHSNNIRNELFDDRRNSSQTARGGKYYYLHIRR